MVRRVTNEFVEKPEESGPYGAKGMAELPTVAVAPAITTAVCSLYEDLEINSIPIDRTAVLKSRRNGKKKTRRPKVKKRTRRKKRQRRLITVKLPRQSGASVVMELKFLLLILITHPIHLLRLLRVMKYYMDYEE